MKKAGFLLVATLVLSACNQPAQQAQTQGSSGQSVAVSHDGLANAEFKGDFPTKDSAEVLADELYFQRATQVYLWSLPAVNIYAMKEGSEKTQKPCACRPCRGTFRRHRESGIRSTTVRSWRCCSRMFSATSGRRQRSLSAFSRCRCPLHFW